MYSEEEKAVAHWIKETQKGYIRIAVLILLRKKSHHGYEIMKEVRERTMGFWKPTAGGVYPILRNLEKSGYVKGEWAVQKNRKRKIYKITEAGNAVLERALAKESQLATSMSDLFKEYMKDVLGVKVSSVQLPKVPNFLSVLLEERKEKPEDTINVLKSKRTQVETIIKEFQRNLEAINARIAQLEHPKKARNK
ncbi:MAG TPA: PadR family transcriptional regulator [Candidatus Bathyarchaeia archaeon]